MTAILLVVLLSLMIGTIHLSLYLSNVSNRPDPEPYKYEKPVNNLRLHTPSLTQKPHQSATIKETQSYKSQKQTTATVLPFRPKNKK